MTMQEDKGGFGAPAPDNVPAQLSETEKIKKGICPSCDSSLAFQEGCKVCYTCGWGGCE